VGIALIATILGQMVFNWLLKWLNASVISMSILGETVGTCILAYFILDEVISLQQCVGILIILTGLASFLIQQNKLNQQTTLENKDRAEL
jgi:drug/metabolite transporter (DMT)-like permease